MVKLSNTYIILQILQLTVLFSNNLSNVQHKVSRAQNSLAQTTPNVHVQLYTGSNLGFLLHIFLCSLLFYCKCSRIKFVIFFSLEKIE